MEKFVLYREEDESGVSGVGIVAEGVVFHNGTVAMSWLTDPTSVAFYQSVADVIKIHGHGGKTQLRYTRGQAVHELLEEIEQLSAEIAFRHDLAEEMASAYEVIENKALQYLELIKQQGNYLGIFGTEVVYYRAIVDELKELNGECHYLVPLLQHLRWQGSKSEAVADIVERLLEK
jgi:hypothetical protein